VLRWLRQYRRRRIQSSPFPAAWSDILAANAPFRSRLAPAAQRKLDHSIQVLVAEKNWEGCGGLSLSDEHRVTIAAHVARLTLGFDDEYFDDVPSILIYPSAYEAPSLDVLGPGVVVEGRSGRLGEAWYRGPVILAWSDVPRAARPRGYQNVVLHEFAHHLDMRNGRSADGVPVIESAEAAKQWLEVVPRDFNRLCSACRHGEAQVLDCYGATSMSEFFAVATEAFFETPRQLASTWPDLFQVLHRFYRQLPA
jgi:Mlc titration factor MtfA (ptsG expression regulator)